MTDQQDFLLQFEASMKNLSQINDAISQNVQNRQRINTYE